jgi:hypothetical protein
MPVTDDLASWSVSLRLREKSSAACTLCNKSNQYNDNLIGRAITIGVDSSGRSLNEDIQDGLTGEQVLFAGAVQSLDRNEVLSNRDLAVKVSSFFNWLTHKSVSTEFYIANSSDVVEHVANIYGTIPSDLRSFNIVYPNKILSTVSGNNLFDELAKLAVASEAEMFIQRGGVLTIEHWKDYRDSPEITLPSELVISTSTSYARGVTPTRIVVRGREISQFKSGERQLKSDTVNPFDGRPESNPVTKGLTCLKHFNAIGEAQTDISLNQLSGSKEDLANATFSQREDANASNLVGVTHVDNSKVGLRVTKNRKTNDETEYKFLDEGEHYLTVDARGKLRLAAETTSSGKPKPLSQNQRRHGRQVDAIVGTLLQQPFSSGVRQGSDGPSNTKLSNEPESSRLEMVVVDYALQSLFGIQEEQIDNDYIGDLETCFDVAVRRFQEHKMSQRVWEVECIYSPLYRINQVIRFRPVQTVSEEITGIITGIEYSWTTNAKTTVKLTVESFEALGATTYYSGNLLLYPEFNGMGVDGWQSVSSGGGYARSLGGYAVLGTEGPGSISVYQDLVCEPGISYEMSFTTIRGEGSSSFACSVTDSSGVIGGTSVNTGSLNTSIFLFTPSYRLVTLSFNLTGQDDGWYVTRPFLRKMVLR